MGRGSLGHILLASFLISLSGAETERNAIELSFDGYDCNSRLVYEDTDYYVRWRGLSNPKCKGVFVPDNRDAKLCIAVESFNIRDCNIRVNYYGGLHAETLEHTYSCNSPQPATYCGYIYGNVGIQIADNGTLSSNPGSFYIKVYPSRQYQNGIVIALSIVGSIIALAVVVAIIFVARRTRSSRATLMPSSTISDSEPLQHSITEGQTKSNYHSFEAKYETFPRKNDAYLEEEETPARKSKSAIYSAARS